ncbi:hypothetical protein C4577_05955 [Candidatus Parcubacteria bacterium]|nr:MAG: hypothetical protein C4577_05955 [Candidatus Parcubacteria bacterium]
MSILKKNKNLLIIFAIFTVLYFFTRLFNVMALPIFTDEAIYTRWSQIARYDAAWRFISLTDGKQPLFVWINMILMRFISDPLLAGRLVSVGAGFFTMIGMFFLSSEIFKNKKIGIIGSFLYLVFPFSLVYDRMALYDSLVACFAVWSLYLEVLLIRLKRLDIALILGLILGGGFLTKSSAFFFAYLLPFSLVLFDLEKPKRVERLLKWGSLALLSASLGYFYYSVLRLSPLRYMINEKNSIFIYPFSEWIQHPLRFFHGNLAGLYDWLIAYLGIPIALLIVFSLIISKKFFREKILLLLWFSIPFVALALFGKTLYPRFILFMTMPLLVLAAYSLFVLTEKFKSKKFKALIIILFVALSLRSDYFIITDIARSPVHRADLTQYVNGWPAGGGMKEIVEYLDEKSKKGKIYVASEGTFGSIPTYVMEIYLDENKNIEKRGMWPLPHEIPQDLIEKAKIMPVYFIFNNTQEPPETTWPIKLVAKYNKGISNSRISLYQVVPNK